MSGQDEPLRTQFFNDALDQLSEAEELVLNLEHHGYDEDSIHTLFRTFHTLKGNSNMVGEGEINQLTHAIESSLESVRKGKESLSSDLIQTTLEAIDLLSMVCQAGDSASYAERINAMTAAVSGDASGDGSASGKGAVSDAAAEAGAGENDREARRNPSPRDAAQETDRQIRLDEEPAPAAGGDFERWRPLLLRFYRIKEVAERLGHAEEDTEEVLMDLGMECIELRSTAEDYGATVERLAAYLEKFSATLYREQIPYNKISYELLYLLLEDLEGLLMRKLGEEGAIREFTVTSIDELRSIPEKLKESSALNVIEIALPEHELFRQKDGMEVFGAISRAAPGRVVCVNAGSGLYQKATALLDEMLEGFIQITGSVEEGLYQLMRAEDKAQ